MQLSPATDRATAARALSVPSSSPSGAMRRATTVEDDPFGRRGHRSQATVRHAEVLAANQAEDCPSRRACHLPPCHERLRLKTTRWEPSGESQARRWARAGSFNFRRASRNSSRPDPPSRPPQGVLVSRYFPRRQTVAGIVLKLASGPPSRPARAAHAPGPTAVSGALARASGLRKRAIQAAHLPRAQVHEGLPKRATPT